MVGVPYQPEAGIKVLDRYVFKELMVPFLIGTVAVVLMFQANLLIFLMKTYSIANIPALALAQMIWFKTPDFLRQTLPVGMALASSLAISRLARESELTAMRSGGASIRRILRPIAAFGLLVAIGNFYLSERLYPVAEKQFTEISQQALILGTSPEYKANVLIKLRNSVAYFASVRRLQDDRLLIQDGLIHEQRRSGEVIFYVAPTGIYDKGVLTFEDAEMYIFSAERVDYYPAKRMTIDEKISLADTFITPQSADKTVYELRNTIEDGKRTGLDTTFLEVDYHSRFAIPTSCLIFALAGPVFAVWFGRSGGFVGVLLSILLVMVYYNMFVVSTQILGRNGWVSPLMAAWLPNAILLGFGLIGLRRLE